MDTVIIDGNGITLEDVERVAKKNIRVELSLSAIEKIKKARTIVDNCVNNGEVKYGITTGFGKFCDVVISKEDNEALQKNLIISHACGVGKPLSIQQVRAVMLLRANALSVGNSGARYETVQALLNFLNSDITPVIPEQGSLGASGDLAPLAHMVLPLIGLGEVFYQNERMQSAEALAKVGLKPIVLKAKEGLALINGTQVMTAIGTLALLDAENLRDSADMIFSLTFQALGGIIDAFDERIHLLRRQTGQIQSAQIIRELLEGSKRITRQGEKRVQDAYTLRCVPQVHGASRDALSYVRSALEKEINAVTDNPIIFPDTGDIISGGNFHGQPIALAMDFLGIAVAELANISERRIERLVNPQLSGLPAFLIKNGGINSGFMITQYAAASLVSENKVLAHPASVDSIPSSANQEDHVSMGTIAARKAASIIANAENVLAIEALCACQAIDLENAKTQLSVFTKKAYDAVRERVDMITEDRVMYTEIDKARELLQAGMLKNNGGK